MGSKDPYKLVSNIRVGESDDRSVRAEIEEVRKKKGDDDDEVINTESSDRAEHPDDCRGDSANDQENREDCGSTPL